MASMYEHETSMTIFYHKSNGDIHSYCTGISDMSMFGDHADDYAMILDYIVVEKDVMLLEFFSCFVFVYSQLLQQMVLESRNQSLNILSFR